MGKNAYDPQFMVDGKYDEKGCRIFDIAHCHDDESNNQAFKIEKHVHNYPHCWRTDNRYFIIRWIAGLSDLQPARNV